MLLTYMGQSNVLLQKIQNASWFKTKLLKHIAASRMVLFPGVCLKCGRVERWTGGSI